MKKLLLLVMTVAAMQLSWGQGPQRAHQGHREHHLHHSRDTTAGHAHNPEHHRKTDKQTHTYAVKGADTLRIDIYNARHGCCMQGQGQKSCGMQHEGRMSGCMQREGHKCGCMTHDGQNHGGQKACGMRGQGHEAMHESNTTHEQMRNHMCNNMCGNMSNNMCKRMQNPESANAHQHRAKHDTKHGAKRSSGHHKEHGAKMSPAQNGKPCILFIFGGGFISGTRDSETYLPFFEFLAREGYTVASMDYRLGMSELVKLKNPAPEDFMRIFTNTLHMAVEDMFDATSYLIANAASLGIDPTMIVPCGSSAGAVTALSGGQALAANNDLARKLPEGFNYAGIISMAGAVMAPVGKLPSPVASCPVMFFHGNADSNVPYDKISEGPLCFYGSKSLADGMRQAGVPYWFMSFEDATHSVAVDPTIGNLDEIATFLNKYVKQRKKLITETTIVEIGKPTVRKDFSVMDYVMSNYGR